MLETLLLLSCAPIVTVSDTGTEQHSITCKPIMFDLADLPGSYKNGLIQTVYEPPMRPSFEEYWITVHLEEQAKDFLTSNRWRPEIAPNTRFEGDEITVRFKFDQIPPRPAWST